jgi:hypothetical protein
MAQAAEGWHVAGNRGLAVLARYALALPPGSTTVRPFGTGASLRPLIGRRAAHAAPQARPPGTR